MTNENSIPGFERPAFDWKQAKTAVEGLRVLFTHEPEKDLSWHQWQLILFTLSPLGMYEAIDVVVLKNRTYLVLYVPTPEDMTQIIETRHQMAQSFGSKTQKKNVSESTTEMINFAAACAMALRRQTGIAFAVSRNKQDGIYGMISYGGLWSYARFESMYGPPQVTDCMAEALLIQPEDPYGAMRPHQDDTIEYGDPSDEFFPTYVRDEIVKELRSALESDDLEVEFTLYQKYQYVMRYMILIRLSKGFDNEESRNTIMQNLMWFMPVHLPLALNTGNEIVVYYTS